MVQTKERVKELQTLQKSKEEEIQEIRQELLSHKIKRDLWRLEKDKPELQESNEPLPQALEVVEIYLKDHSIARAARPSAISPTISTANTVYF